MRVGASPSWGKGETMKRKKIKSIILILENCEIIEIPKENIYNFGVNINKKNISLCNGDEIHESNLADWFYISISKLDEILMARLGEKKKTEKALKRIKNCLDITGIELSFDNGEKVEFYPPWGGDMPWCSTNLYAKMTKRIHEVWDTKEKYGIWTIEIKERPSLLRIIIIKNKIRWFLKHIVPNFFRNLFRIKDKWGY
jgi:hypothetical protein